MEVSGNEGVKGVNKQENLEYTSPEIKQEYERLLGIIKSILEKESSLTEEDYFTFQNAMDALDKMSQKPGFTSTMTENKNSIFNTLGDAGLVPGMSMDGKTGLELIKMIKSLSVTVEGKPVKFAELLGMILGTVKYDDLTLQATLAVFIKEGAGYLAEKLEKLNEVLVVNQKVLEILEKIKRLRNKSTHPPTPGEGKPTPPKSLSEYIAEYGPMGGILRYGNDVAKYNTDMANYETNLKNPKTPKIVFSQEDSDALLKLQEELKAQLEDLGKAGIVPDKAGNLADRIDQVVKDLDEVFKGANDLKKKFPADTSQWTDAQKAQYNEEVRKGTFTWFLDGQDQVGGNAGKFSDAIGDAVTSAETLNSNQKDKINQAFFVFEQFQKITATVMAALNEVVKKFAQAPGRSS